MFLSFNAWRAKYVIVDTHTYRFYLLHHQLHGLIQENITGVSKHILVIIRGKPTLGAVVTAFREEGVFRKTNRGNDAYTYVHRYSAVTKFETSNTFLRKINKSKIVVKPMVFETKIFIHIISQYFFDIQNSILRFESLVIFKRI